MKPVRVVVCGVAGRMGGRILQAVRAEDGMQVVGATERPEAPQVGLDAGTAAGGPPLGVTVSGSLETARKAQIRFAPLVRALFCETNPLPVKHALFRMGKIAPELRLPLVPVSEKGAAQVDAALAAYGLT